MLPIDFCVFVFCVHVVRKSLKKQRPQQLLHLRQHPTPLPEYKEYDYVEGEFTVTLPYEAEEPTEKKRAIWNLQIQMGNGQ